ncbi:MAG TPA: ATP-binding protein [Candidatus Limnocylindrales bacterium]|nr:ATP-binding protein [Candidatus Limnocylindrales bacterium]
MNGSRVTVVGVVSLGLLSIVAGFWLPLNSGFLAFPDSPTTMAILALDGVIWLLAAVVTLERQPANPLWKLILAYLVWNELVWAMQFVPNSVIQGLAATFAPMAIALYVHVLVAYPSGRVPLRFDRRLVVFVYAFVVVVYLLPASMWQPARDGCASAWCPDNVLLVWPNKELADAMVRTAQLLAPILGALVLYAIWRHWRVAGPAARRALVPVAIAVPIAYVVHSARYVAQALQLEPVLSFLDTYHVVTLTVDAIVPVGLLFGVLRLRLDRGRVAELVVELGRGVPAGGLRDLLARALADPTLQLAFAAPSGAGYIDGAGQPVELTQNPERALARIERDGEALAVLVHDRTIDNENPGLVEAVSSAARLAIENEQLTAQVRAQLEEVRASRARIVDAADAERQRVERDLHDGAQQRLLALAVRLQVARDASGNAGALIDEATAELHAAIAEVRNLARGIHPPILAEAGLAAALETLAERSPIPVRLEATDARYRAAVEIAAFYVVAEALANAARHAGATEAAVSVSNDGQWLTVKVSDDGRGGADPSGGSGLRGLADRVAAVGGRLTVTSPPGEGTTVAAELPLQ